MDRIDRAKSQRLYLLTVDRHVDGWGASFAVLGSTGNVYKVEFGIKPSCDCPDFLKGRGLCKHVLFIWLRVLRCSSDDPRIWQEALLSMELKAAVEPLFGRKACQLSSMATEKVRQAYARATGSTQEPETAEVPERYQCKRQEIEGEDCPICFEAMELGEEGQSLLTFCCACGNNFHKDCIQRWQRASSGHCPLCRQPWRTLCKLVKPGNPLPQLPASSGSLSSHAAPGHYLNLANMC